MKLSELDKARTIATELGKLRKTYKDLTANSEGKMEIVVKPYGSSSRVTILTEVDKDVIMQAVKVRLDFKIRQLRDMGVEVDDAE